MTKYMIYSMTGFASKTFILTTPSGERSSISINLKSLNSRFFECTVKLPLGLSHLETTFIKQFKEMLRRGHIYFTAHLSNPNIFDGSVTPVMTIIDGYMAAMNHIKAKYQLSDEIKL
ncbi:MAG TPA: YicC/YloC family endoribonuclease, partial [Nitrosopumilaceae archaeon]|nr:YicC/YloC family endoribonuclease [Nitrosopumilaceae archaeon]